MWIPDAMKPRMIKEEWIYHSAEKPSIIVNKYLSIYEELFTWFTTSLGCFENNRSIIGITRQTISLYPSLGLLLELAKNRPRFPTLRGISIAITPVGMKIMNFIMRIMIYDP